MKFRPNWKKQPRAVPNDGIQAFGSPLNKRAVSDEMARFTSELGKLTIAMFFIGPYPTKQPYTD